MLGVLKTGAAYLPIDPAHPGSRIEFMIADAAPMAALTTAGLAERLAELELVVIDVDDPRLESYPGTALPVPAADDLAYVIYTSGTTGRAQGGGDHPCQCHRVDGLVGRRLGRRGAGLVAVAFV